MSFIEIRSSIRNACLLCGLLAPTLLYAQTSPGISELPTLHLTTYQTSNSIISPIDCEIVLVNLTNKTYDIQSVKLYLPQSLSAIRPEFKEAIRSELHSIGGEDERIYSFGISRVDMNLWETLFDKETLFFVPGQYRLRAEVELKESGNEENIRNLYATTELTLEPPLNAVLRGGVIGALLLALFVPAYRVLYRRHNPGAENTSQIRFALGQFFVYFVSGSVVSITAILLIYRIGNANLPISITVNDYLGGIIVGLFSYVIGNALYRQFFEKSEQ